MVDSIETAFDPVGNGPRCVVGFWLQVSLLFALVTRLGLIVEPTVPTEPVFGGIVFVEGDLSG